MLQTASEQLLQQIASPPFRYMIERCVVTYRAHYGERLLAIYVWGSVHRNEAVLGVSDLDMVVFTTDTDTEADHTWRTQADARLREELPDFSGLARPVQARNTLQAATQPGATASASGLVRAWTNRLRYDATLVWGHDLLEGQSCQPPARAWARGAFESVYDLTRWAAGLEPENLTDFSLPTDLALRQRKLARLGVLAGAYLLVAEEQELSFRGADVLPRLRERFPQWRAFLDTTDTLYIQPSPTTPEQIKLYLAQLVRWVEEVHKELKHG